MNISTVPAGIEDLLAAAIQLDHPGDTMVAQVDCCSAIHTSTINTSDNLNTFHIPQPAVTAPTLYSSLDNRVDAAIVDYRGQRAQITRIPNS